MQGNKTYFFHILKQTIGPQNLCYLLMNVVKFSSNSNLVFSNLITTVQKMHNSWEWGLLVISDQRLCQQQHRLFSFEPKIRH